MQTRLIPNDWASTTRSSLAYRWVIAMFVGLLTAAAGAAPASGKDRVYWANFGPNGASTNTISYANLDGSGGGNVSTAGAPIDGPMGLAIDSPTGRLYWANLGSAENGTTLAFANADGSGGGGVFNGPITTPHGVAIDRGAGKIYWTNEAASTIGFANLDGTGAGIVDWGNATLVNPRGLAIDPAAGRIYWANHVGPPARISYANLDGSGGADIPTGGATVDDPEGVAIDPVTNRIYWGNFGPASSISWASLNGSGGANLPTPGVSPNFPHGVAIDPDARKIYWPDYGPGDLGDGTTISWANLDGSGGGHLATGAATVHGPALPILLKTPKGTGAPSIQGHPASGSKLHCTRGGWAPDLLSSLLYRAPASISYRWRRDKHLIAHKDSISLRARKLGDYRCVATAHNAAGIRSQTSAPLAVFKIGKPDLDRASGTARLKVTVPDPGKLRLTSGGGLGHSRHAPSVVRPQAKRLHRPGTTTLLVKPKGKAKKRLRQAGRVKVKIEVLFKPKGEHSDHQIRTLRLKQS
jgi:hypothetical protein